MNFRLLKTTFHKKHGADRICFTHHPSSVICSSKYNLDATGGDFFFNVPLTPNSCDIIFQMMLTVSLAESLRYLSMYDNRCLRYFKGHKERFESLDFCGTNNKPMMCFGSLVMDAYCHKLSI